jgi:hypothetical protein
VEVEKLADKIVELCGNRFVVALHNNRGGFSIRWYEQGGESYRGAHSLVHRGKVGTEHDFVIVTWRTLYEMFAVADYGVVYQEPSHDVNDGSLSYRYGRDGVPYVNVETSYSAGDTQWNIVKFAYELYMRE